MSDITEHAQFGDLKRLLRKLEKAEARQDEPLSSLVRHPSPVKSPPPLPDVAHALRVASPSPDLDESLKVINSPDHPGAADDRSLPVNLAHPAPVSGSGAGARRTAGLVIAVAAVGLAATVVWAGRLNGILDWPLFLVAAQDHPVQIVDKDASLSERIAPPSPSPPTSLPEAKVNTTPNPGPPPEGPPPEATQRAKTVPAEADTVKPAGPPAEFATRLAEGRTDAPLLGGRDKYELEARLDAYLEHGQKLLDDGDVTGARAFFSRVADSGDPRGAEAMGLTYDPNYIVSIGIRGLQPDPEAASRWYRRAMDLGSKDAMDRLEHLGDRPK